MAPGALETVSLANILAAFATLGPFGIVIILWWLDMKNMSIRGLNHLNYL